MGEWVYLELCHCGEWFYIYDNATGWSGITEIIARGKDEGIYWNNCPRRSLGKLFDL